MSVTVQKIHPLVLVLAFFMAFISFHYSFIILYLSLLDIRGANVRFFPYYQMFRLSFVFFFSYLRKVQLSVVFFFFAKNRLSLLVVQSSGISSSYWVRSSVFILLYGAVYLDYGIFFFDLKVRTRCTALEKIKKICFRLKILGLEERSFSFFHLIIFFFFVIKLTCILPYTFSAARRQKRKCIEYRYMKWK